MVSKIGICQLIACAAFCGDYYVTYKFASNNSMAEGDRVYISKAMTQYNGEKVYEFEIETNASNEKELLKNSQDEIIDNLLGYEVKVKSTSLGTLSQIYDDKAEILVYPTRIRIELNEGFAIIAIIK